MLQTLRKVLSMISSAFFSIIDALSRIIPSDFLNLGSPILEIKSQCLLNQTVI